MVQEQQEQWQLLHLSRVEGSCLRVASLELLCIPFLSDFFTTMANTLQVTPQHMWVDSSNKNEAINALLWRLKSTNTSRQSS